MLDLDALNEQIELNRDFLATCPPTYHAFTSFARARLASSLHECYQRAGQTPLLDEAITIDREVLALRRTRGHRDRGLGEACGNLAVSLQHLFERTGDTELLDEAIPLQREALALLPRQHPSYARCCGNLACALQHRYTQTGNTILLNEAIELHYLALAMRPPKHPDCALCCRNLGDSLRVLYKLARNPDALDIAITLERLSVSLLPRNHSDRALSCRNLSGSLFALSESQSLSSSTVLEEAISWAREALALLPHEHHERAKFLSNLSLMLEYQSAKKRVDDLATYKERVELAREAVRLSPPSRRYAALFTLFSIEFLSDVPHFSATQAIDTLSSAFDAMPDDTRCFARNMNRCLEWVLCRGNPTPEEVSLLLDLCSKLIDLLPRITGFSPNVESQLEFTETVHGLGSTAWALAYLSGRPAQAVELLDQTHGIIWTQTLHQRDPQIRELPERLGVELEKLLRAVSSSDPTGTVDAEPLSTTNSSTNYLSLEDIRDVQNSRIQAILTEVRTIPGLERFMLGSTYADLRETAYEHPVVVLVTAGSLVCAIIISNSFDIEPRFLVLGISADRLSELHDDAKHAGLRGGQPVDGSDRNENRMRSESAGKIIQDKIFAILSELWLHVVKPVLDHLELQVCLRA
jgi:tetratricopeptide (TPR) repeat protein